MKTKYLKPISPQDAVGLQVKDLRRYMRRHPDPDYAFQVVKAGTLLSEKLGMEFKHLAELYAAALVRLAELENEREDEGQRVVEE